MQEVHDFLKKVGTYWLATDEGGQPRVRPFGTIDIFEGKLYIQTGKSKPVSKQLAANPKGEIAAFDPESGVWIRVAATFVNDDSAAAQEHMLEGYPMLKDRYSVNDGNMQVLYLKDAVATFSSFTGEPREVRF
ncbi:MAG: pyridoxamine 5'-phosphate oxidase family protein [Clostridiales Family XIII bacterium]|jgi:uncharacterized pyridoxamine 5'-phosphate oxidase family protein|nr:pyridoxamine 5'-phosphate oxidase family protein [Clostridiales Family XIII bacterium]